MSPRVEIMVSPSGYALRFRRDGVEHTVPTGSRSRAEAELLAERIEVTDDGNDR